jgi:hypothetical protein
MSADKKEEKKRVVVLLPESAVKELRDTKGKANFEGRDFSVKLIIEAAIMELGSDGLLQAVKNFLKQADDDSKKSAAA